MRVLRGWWQDRRGATAIEYGLIAAIMASLIVLGFGAMSTSLQGFFSRLAAYLTSL